MKGKVPLATILHLYQKEKLSAKAIADRFGLTRQAISYRLRKARVRTRTIQPWVELPDAKTLQRLYLKEGFTLHKIVDELNSNLSRVFRAMDRYGIPRRKTGTRDGKYPELRKLSVGGFVELLNSARQPHGTFYSTAKKAGIRVSVRRISQQKFRVTRVE